MAIAAHNQSEQLSSTRNALDTLQNLVKDDLLAVNHTIVERMQSPVLMIPQLAGHLISSGGKRLRPVLTLLCSRLCGYQGARHIPLAACVEFIHTATLLHDDVVDDSLLRRGIESANSVWGNQASVLVGDFLFSRAFQIMVEDGSLRVLDILSEASAVIAEGEVQQLANSNDLGITEQDCLSVISAKTAKLFAAACEVGAVVSERPPKTAVSLANFGLNFGISFQLVDDIIDSAGTVCNAATALQEAGATSVVAYVAHGVLSGEAVTRVASSSLEQLVITDSIQATQSVRQAQNIRVLSIATLIAEAMRRISEESSVSSLFN